MSVKSTVRIIAGISLFLLPLFSSQMQGDAALVITIEVAPNVLNLSSNGTVVTVHTSLPYSQVVGATVKLNGTEISWWKMDNRGYFVAKFNMQDIKDLPLLLNAYNTMTIEGFTVNNVPFIGSKEILVLSNTSSK